MLKNCASKRKICENEKHTHYTLFWTVWFVWFWFFIGCRAERTSFCFVSSFRSPWLDHPNDYETFFEKFLILTCYSFKQLCLELFCGDAWHFNSTFRFLRLSDQIIILNYDLKKNFDRNLQTDKSTDHFHNLLCLTNTVWGTRLAVYSNKF